MKTFQILIFSFIFLSVSAQKPYIKEILEMKHIWAGLDRLEQIYVQTGGYQIQKYNKEAKLLYTYNENKLGVISQIDVSNPMQTLVFYRELQITVVLDRTLSEVARIRWNDWGLFQISTLAAASDNKIWIYDLGSFCLKKIGLDGKQSIQGPDLSNLLEEDFQPQYIVEHESYVYVFDKKYHLLQFDLMGNFIRKFDNILKSPHFFMNEAFLIFNGYELERYQLDLFRFQKVDLNKELSLQDIHYVSIGKERWLLSDENKIYIVQFN